MRRQQLRALLEAIESGMRRLSLRSEYPPCSEAFDSEIPFFLDKMAFHIWMLWAFVPRFRALLIDEDVMPVQCAVAPILEEYCRANALEEERWVALVQQFDLLISER